MATSPDFSGVRGGEHLACRAAILDDVQAVLKLVNAAKKHDAGEPLLEEADIVGDWQRPSFDLASESVCVFDGDQLVAYGEVYKGRRAEVSVHPRVRGRGIGTTLLRWTWSVSRARRGTLIGQTVVESSDAVELFRAYGYTELWTSWILELPGDAEITLNTLPPEVEIRGYRPGEERQIFGVVESAFSEWPDRDPSAYEDWEASLIKRPDFEPWQLIVAVESTAGDVELIVGACHIGVSDGEGWVGVIAVRQDRRGLGFGRALLSRAFAAAREHGAGTSALSTDSRTGTLGLYEHVGMRVKQPFVHYAREI